MLIRGDARFLPLRDSCVDCVVTSPPYFGLRDYGSRTQIGLESTVTGYVDSICSVFREVRRVLSARGTVWLNLGDSYVSVGAGTQGIDGEMASRRVAQVRDRKAIHGTVERPPSVLGVAPKNMLGIPWRVAFALQADGWYLRSDIIWSKPNPMPESVTDRPTKAHEYLFLLTKSERYSYDADAIAEPVSASMLTQVDEGYDGLGLKDYEAAGVQNPSSVKARIIANARAKNIVGNISERGVTRTTEGLNLKTAAEKCNGMTRNRRTVWTIPTMPYSGWLPNYEASDYVGPDGKPYKASGDCLIHAPLAGRRSQQMAEGGGQLDRDELRSLDIAARRVSRLIVAHAANVTMRSVRSIAGTVPAQNPESIDDYKTPNVRNVVDDLNAGDGSLFHTSRTTDPATPTDDNQDSPALGSAVLATSHNNESRRTGRAVATTAAYIASAETGDDTGDTSTLLDSADSVDRTDASKNAVGDLVAEPSAERPHRSVRTELPSCKCSVLGTDHFATMPEKLVEPCILAGCPMGGLVLDPFCGTFTVGAVAARLGRKAVGVDLSYQGLAWERTRQRGLSFGGPHADAGQTLPDVPEDVPNDRVVRGSEGRRSTCPDPCDEAGSLEVSARE